MHHDKPHVNDGMGCAHHRNVSLNGVASGAHEITLISLHLPSGVLTIWGAKLKDRRNFSFYTVAISDTKLDEDDGEDSLLDIMCSIGSCKGF